MPQPDPAPPAGRARPLVVAFTHRLANTGLEMMALLTVLGIALEPLVRLAPWLHPAAVFAVGFVGYFAGFWASRFCATPMQMAGRLKVVDYRGERLGPWRALLRAVTLIVLVAGAASLVATFRNPMLWFVAGPAMGLLLLAVFTRHRQAAHDLLSGSVVVYRRALDAPGGPERLAAALAGGPVEPPPGTWRWAGWLVRDVLAVLVPVALVFTFAGVQFDRDLLGRVDYAVQNTDPLKDAVQGYFDESGRLPSGPQALGSAAVKTPYPDGGYYYLDDEGRIAIHFTVIPELTRGSLLLTPTADGGRVTWTCTRHGDIKRGHLPGYCRD